MKSITIRFIFLSIFIIVLIGFIAFARGYRLDIKKQTITSTGIISVNSLPQPAQVFINGELKGVTDLNLTLPHGKYTVEVKKEGYTDWKKDFTLKGEIVMNADALLFSKNPSLTPMTSLGISKAITLGQSDRMLIITENNSIEKDGIYLFEASKRTINFFPPLKPILLKENLRAILTDVPELNLANSKLDFSPDYQEAILTLTIQGEDYSYSLALDGENKQLSRMEPGSKENIIEAWNQEKNKELVQILETLPKDMRKIASDSFQMIAISPDEKKFMYMAKKPVTLPLIIKPQLIGTNQTPEKRNLETGEMYIYDKKEDKNFKLPIVVNTEVVTPTPSPSVIPTIALIDEPTPTPSKLPYLLNEPLTDKINTQVKWYPDSQHVVFKENKKIVVVAYDGTNKQTVYSGPFEQEFFTLSGDWNLVVISNLNPQNNKFGDLYSIGIK